MLAEMSGCATTKPLCTVTVATEVDEPIVDVVGYIHGGHPVEPSLMSNSIKGLTGIQHDDHYIGVG